LGNEKVLVLGGAKSGKSEFALRLGESIGAKMGKGGLYVATAQALDQEMEERISRHRDSRSGYWQTLEEPFKVWEPIENHDGKIGVILVDCLTLWLSNVLASPVLQYDECLKRLIGALEHTQKSVIMVSNEVGLGIVPAIREARMFRDAAGELHQKIAKKCDKAFFVIAGMAIELKGEVLTHD